MMLGSIEAGDRSRVGGLVGQMVCEWRVVDQKGVSCGSSSGCERRVLGQGCVCVMSMVW